jgi:hypothetical protein
MKAAISRGKAFSLTMACMPDTNSIKAARSPSLVGTGNGGDALSMASMSRKARVGRRLPGRLAQPQM